MKNENIFSSELKKVLEKAEDVARDFGTHYIATEHVIYAMLNTVCLAGKILKSCGVASLVYSRYFMKTLDRSAMIDGFTPRVKCMIEEAKGLASGSDGKDAVVGTEHLLLAVISCKDCLATEILEGMGVDISKIESALETVLRIQ